MDIPQNLDILLSQLDRFQASSNYVEVAATVMPQRTIGLKHMLRPACRFFPVPMSLGWQENPVDDDYPQGLLVQGLMLTDVESGATRRVDAPWMHALYDMTYKECFNGVMEVKLEEGHFTGSFTWQHIAVLLILFSQGIIGLWALAHRQFREGIYITFGVLLQIMEGYYASKFPTYRDPRSVAKARTFVLHTGMTTTHFLLISHQPNQKHLTSDKPYLSLEDAAVPMPILRKKYRRIFEISFRRALQLGNMGLKLGAVLSQANGLLIPGTLLFGTVASELVMMFQTPMPKMASIEPLETTKRNPSILDKVTAICQRTGCISVPFVEAALPDRDGTHVDFRWLGRILGSENVLVAGMHPNHQTASEVFSAALKRRTRRRR